MTNSPTTGNDLATPSRFALIVLGIAVVVFVVALSIAPSPAVDLFWQMRTGQIIVSTGHVPHFDTFSWTRNGHPWIVHEWGMCVLLWSTFKAGGFAGVWVLEAVLLLAIFLTLYLLLHRETRGAPLTAFCLTLWACKMSSPLIAPRPHLFTYLFLIVCIGILLAARRGNPKLLWWLVPTCVMWANFHGGVILGVGLIALFGVCDLVEAGMSRSGTSTIGSGPLPPNPAGTGLVKPDLEIGKRQLVVAACCAVGLSINPYGWHIYEIFTQTVGNKTMPSFVSEWSALDFHDPLGLLFEAMFAIICAGLVFTRESRSLAEIATVVLLAHASLTASRNVPLFAFAGLLVTARHIQSTLDRFLSRKGEDRPELFGPRPPSVISVVVAIAVVAVSTMTAVDQMRRSPDRSSGLAKAASTSFALHYFPADAVRFLKTEQLPADWRMYNDYNLGSYLMWSMPERKISMDTQTDVFFGGVLDDYARLDQQPFGWEKILAFYHPDFVVMSAAEPQARLFYTSPRWALVWADTADLDSSGSSNALIFIKNSRENASVIERCRRDCPTLVRHPEMALQGATQ